MTKISERARRLEEELTRQFRMEYTGVVDQFVAVIQAALDAERREGEVSVLSQVETTVVEQRVRAEIAHKIQYWGECACGSAETLHEIAEEIRCTL
jgi:hypothetical protein